MIPADFDSSRASTFGSGADISGKSVSIHRNLLLANAARETSDVVTPIAASSNPTPRCGPTQTAAETAPPAHRPPGTSSGKTTLSASQGVMKQASGKHSCVSMLEVEV